ncbi:MAG: ATP-binding cassette domain-containing protein [Gammaproteobacteria bacterium]|nr:ATP-binding cassette domain-containing protein [Gammaproteobacteria bacterium]
MQTMDYRPLIEARQIEHHFNGQALFHPLDITIESGQYISLIGLNGAGKSTLLRLLLKLIPHQRGSIEHRADLRIGYVPQRWHANAQLPISGRDFLSLNLSANADKTMQHRLDELMETWQCLPFAHQPIHTLSGGQWQRLLLTRALLNQPQLLALDEPTQGLDLHAQHEFYQQLQQLHHQGVTILMISHDLAHAMSYSQRVIALSEGRICCDGTPQTLLNHAEYQRRFVCAHQDAIVPHAHCGHSHHA